jgi:tetratricopeptide (TPR) repeat protein
MDGYQWIVHAQRLLGDGGWRVRRTDIDNYPAGREVHWSSGLIWWLLLLGRVGGGSAPGAGPAIERAALFACPLLHAIFLLLLTVVAYRRFGAATACVVALALATVPRFVEFFRAGYVDHHGLAAVAGFACVLFAAAAGAGWVRHGSAAAVSRTDPAGRRGTSHGVPDERAATRWIIASALAGSAGLWVSAASQVPVLVGIGLGALAAAGRWPRTAPDPSLRYLPRLWRTWGWAGAGGSLLFYLLEYVPHSMGMRLEVNHPLYAVAWAGAGELLFRICRRLRGGRLIEDPPDKAAIPLAVIAVAVLPALILIAPGRFFWVSDHFVWTLHRGISEFQNIFRHVHDFGIRRSLSTISILPLLAIPAGLALGRARLDAYRKGMLAVTLFPAIVLGVLATAQVRWLGNQEALWIAVLAVITALVSDSTLRLPTWGVRAAGVFVVVIFLQFPLSVVRSAVIDLRPPLELGLEDRFQLVMRDVAQKLRSRAGDRPLVVLAGPTAMTAMIYFGGLHGLGTLYWENRDGLKAAASIYGAPNLEVARERVLEHRVTHLVFFTWDDFGGTYARLHRGLPVGRSARDVFAIPTASPLTLPTWAQVLDYRIPPDLGMTGQDVLILEVRPEQTEDEHFLGMGAYCVEQGDLASAVACYRRSLALRPDQPVALIGMTEALIRWGRAGEAAPYLDRVAAVVPVSGRAEAASEISSIGRKVSVKDARTAVALYRRALALDPHCRTAGNNLAWILATSADVELRNGQEAVVLAAEVVRSDGGGDPLSLDTLAAAYARSGRWDDAVATASRAVRSAEEKGTKSVEAIRARLERYRAAQSYEQPAAQPHEQPARRLLGP